MCGLPELTSALIRSGRPFELLTSHIADPEGLKSIGEYASAAGAARRLNAMRIGMIGHPFEGMTDLMVDYSSLRDIVGPVVWPIEPEKVAAAAVQMDAGRVKTFIREPVVAPRCQRDAADSWIAPRGLALALLDVAQQGGFDALATFDQVWLTDPRWASSPASAPGICAHSTYPWQRRRMSRRWSP